MIQAAADTGAFQWGPLIFTAVVSFAVVGATALIAFGSWIVRRLTALGMTDILNSRKAHDELMDLKLASAEMNEVQKQHGRWLAILQGHYEETMEPKAKR